jgi:hypothetical protein
MKHRLVGFPVLTTLLVTLGGVGATWAATIDPTNRTVTTTNFFVGWSTTNDTEAIITIEWMGGQNLTSTEAIGTCDPGAPGAVEYFGNSYAPPDPEVGGLTLVAGGTTTPPGTTAWTGQILSSGTAQVTINSMSTGCPPASAGIIVNTVYNFLNPDDPNTNSFGVQRSFNFTTTTFDYDFRPYMPRLSLAEGYTEVLYPAVGGTLETINVYDCPTGCTGPVSAPGAAPLSPPWDSTQGWFAMHNPTTLQGMIVMRTPSTDPQGNPITPQLWVDNDAGSNTNVASFLLLSPTGGFTGGLVTEVETMCFYDSSIWTPSLTPPAGCNAGVTLSPGSLTFGDQATGTSSPAQTVTLSNNSSSLLTISSIAITGTDSGDYSETNGCGTSLATGTSCPISVTFTPTATGTRTATLTVTDSDPSSPQTSSLTGTGTSPAVTLSPASLTFGNQAVGTSSAPAVATLTNSTANAATITGISITGADSGDYSETNNCGTSLGAGASCSISVTFTPAAAGTRTATLTVSDNGSGSPQTASLTGTGTQPAVTLSPTSLSFPWQFINTNSSPLPVTLTNSGNGTLSISSILAAGPFNQTNTCGSSLGAGLSCTINVVFQPTSENTFTGSVTITDNAPGSPQVVSLSGQAFGKPRLSAGIVGQSPSGTTITATLQITDDGTGAAQQVWINAIRFETLDGTGTVTLVNPSLPVSVGNLAIGASADVTLTLDVPATVKKFSLTEKGTLQNLAGNAFNFAEAEVIYP